MVAGAEAAASLCPVHLPVAASVKGEGSPIWARWYLPPFARPVRTLAAAVGAGAAAAVHQCNPTWSQMSAARLALVVEVVGAWVVEEDTTAPRPVRSEGEWCRSAEIGVTTVAVVAAQAALEDTTSRRLGPSDELGRMVVEVVGAWVAEQDTTEPRRRNPLRTQAAREEAQSPAAAARRARVLAAPGGQRTIRPGERCTRPPRATSS